MQQKMIEINKASERVLNNLKLLKNSESPLVKSSIFKNDLLRTIALDIDMIIRLTESLKDKRDNFQSLFPKL